MKSLATRQPRTQGTHRRVPEPLLGKALKRPLDWVNGIKSRLKTLLGWRPVKTPKTRRKGGPRRGKATAPEKIRGRNKIPSSPNEARAINRLGQAKKLGRGIPNQRIHRPIQLRKVSKPIGKGGETKERTVNQGPERVKAVPTHHGWPGTWAGTNRIPRVLGEGEDRSRDAILRSSPTSSEPLRK